ncbi:MULTISPECIES: hypothetical protein [Microvirga]|uniref:hypothetical protein n=1 Tax=Microvirga TaxID=186650 RepID=UPI0021C86BD2|nr:MULTISPECIES: hypothetical protein [unclassified Microvirga]
MKTSIMLAVGLAALGLAACSSEDKAVLACSEFANAYKEARLKPLPNSAPATWTYDQAVIKGQSVEGRLVKAREGSETKYDDLACSFVYTRGSNEPEKTFKLDVVSWSWLNKPGHYARILGEDTGAFEKALRDKGLDRISSSDTKLVVP